MKLHSSFALLGILSLAKPSATTPPAPSVERIRELFSVWKTGEGLEFIYNVRNCKFVVPGSHRFTGVYDRERIHPLRYSFQRAL
jgi:hypothetical protein